MFARVVLLVVVLGAVALAILLVLAALSLAGYFEAPVANPPT